MNVAEWVKYHNRYSFDVNATSKSVIANAKVGSASSSLGVHGSACPTSLTLAKLLVFLQSPMTDFEVNDPPSPHP